MKRTTIALDERLLQRIRKKARREGRAVQDCVNELLALGLAASAQRADVADPLPTFSLGAAAVDVADREALYDLMEGRE